MTSTFRRLPSCMAFYDHPRVKEKHCVRQPGVGFSYKGTRLLGITEFLRRTYYPVFTATRRSKGRAVTKKGKRSKGLIMGSMADSAITAYVKTGNTRKMAACPAARRLAAFLHCHKLKIVDAHVLIFEPNYGIATEMDVLCHGSTGLIVIENKTTLQTRAEHEQTYRRPDRDQPTLLRGLYTLHNSEYVHHQLQLACMLIMLKNTYNITATGHVLVASSDGLNHYPMSQDIINKLAASLYTRKHFHPAPKCLDQSIPLINYAFRPFVPKQPQPVIEECPPAITKFFLKNAPSAIDTCVLNYNTGKLSFLQRPDINLDMTVDLYAESTTTVYLFLIKSTLLTQKECANIIDIHATVLPSGHKASFYAICSLELALAARALNQPKKIELRVLYLPTGAKPYLRKIPISYLSKLR